MARQWETFFKQYDLGGRTFMQAQMSSPMRDHRRVFRAQFDFSLKGKRLLDVGCGYGRDLPFYAKRGARVYGTDPSSTMIELAKQHCSGSPNLSVQPVQKTTFPDRFFDVVTSTYALHNAPNLRQAFRELHRILKPKGLLIFLVQHPLFVFLLKKKKTYRSKTLVRFTIPDPRFPCTILQPAHTFSEYFNEFVLDRFDLLDFAEGKEAVPLWFLAKLRKR
jgi:ubiquinone/menaquinone biosynthesis C-methylase UbiE